MGWREEKEKADKMEAEAKRKRQEFMKTDFGFGLGSRGSSSGGSNLSSLLKNLSGSDKFPEDKFEREFIIDLDNTVLDIKSIYSLLKTYGKKGTSSTRFSGINQESIITHLGKVMSKYRPEAFKIIQDQYYSGGS
jgi:hypothetical protein